jgi:hypothetical protein
MDRTAGFRISRLHIRDLLPECMDSWLVGRPRFSTCSSFCFTEEVSETYKWETGFMTFA